MKLFNIHSLTDKELKLMLENYYLKGWIDCRRYLKNKRNKVANNPNLLSPKYHKYIDSLSDDVMPWGI